MAPMMDRFARAGPNLALRRVAEDQRIDRVIVMGSPVPLLAIRVGGEISTDEVATLIDADGVADSSRQTSRCWDLQVTYLSPWSSSTSRAIAAWTC